MTNELWLTKGEVLGITGWSARNVEWKAQSNALRYKWTERATRNGKRERLYAASSLPAECQPKLLELCVRRAAQEVNASLALPGMISDGAEPTAILQASAQASLFSPVLTMDTPELADLDDEQRETARQRFDVVQSILEWRSGERGPFHARDGRYIKSLNDFVEYRAAMLGTSPRTLYKWLARYDNGGETPIARFKALADRARGDRGKWRIFEKYPKAAEYALIKYLGLAPSAYLEAARELRLPEECGLDYRMPQYHSERLAMTAVYEGIEREWPNWYNHGSKPPSYTTIRNFLQSIPACIKIMAREGEQAYENKCEPHSKRRWEATPVNAVWNSDHRIFDVFGWNDYFQPFLIEPGAWMRVWLTTIEDMRSRRIVGWCFSVNPSSRSVASAMRMAAMRYGLPRQLYIDNGEDYKLFGRILRENFGIEPQFAKPFRPRSKPIESWHGTLSVRFDPLFGPAYAGRDAKDRSEENCEALRQHKLWREGRAASTPLPPVSHLMEVFAAWVEDEYNEWPHSGQGMMKLSPRVVYDREFPPEIRQPYDVARLEPLFWQRDTRVVRNGRVQLWNQQYEPADAESDVRLRLLPEGAEVRVACNPDDIAMALCYDIEGPDHKFIARLKAPQLLLHDPVSRNAISAMEKDNARFRKGVKQFQRTLARRAVAAGIASELDSLAQRAAMAVPMPTTAAAARALVLPPAPVRDVIGPNDNAVAPPSAAQSADEIFARYFDK